jgi:hypothetical protein
MPEDWNSIERRKASNFVSCHSSLSARVTVNPENAATKFFRKSVTVCQTRPPRNPQTYCKKSSAKFPITSAPVMNLQMMTKKPRYTYMGTKCSLCYGNRIRHRQLVMQPNVTIRKLLNYIFNKRNSGIHTTVGNSNILSRVGGYAWLITGSRSDDWIYWCFFTITFPYNSSQSVTASGCFPFLPGLRESSLPQWLAS